LHWRGNGCSVAADTVANILEGALRKAKGCCTLAAGIEPMADLHASAEYRRRAALTLAVRAIADAYQDAATRRA
jgi:CO/xanthine dehydrogenase FAD-binding subunit